MRVPPAAASGSMDSMDDRFRPKDRRAAFLRLLQYLRPHSAALALGISSNIGLGLVALVPPLIYGRITDDVILAKGDPDARLRLLALLALLLAAIYALNSLLSFARGYVMHVLGEKLILTLRKDVYGHLQQLSVSFFDRRQTGEIMSRVTSDTQVVEEFVNHAADTLVSDVIKMVAMCVVMFLISPVLSIIALVPVPVLFYAGFRFARRIKSIYRAVRERLGEINAGIQERISGVRVVKAFAREEHEFENFRRDAENYYDERVRAVRMWTSFFPSVDLLVRLGHIAVWVAGPVLILRGEATMGTLVVFTSYLGMLYQPVGSLARINDTIQRSLAAAERIFEILDEEPGIKDPPRPVPLGRIRGEVEFEHVWFRYEDGEEVLKDICLHARPGQIIALVGRSGAGKTSLVNLIPRFYDPTQGRVLIDGVDVRDVRQTELASPSCAGRSPWCCRIRSCSTAPSGRTSATGSWTPPTRRSSRRRRRPTRTTSSWRCRTATTRRSASGASSSPAVRSSGWPSRAPSWPTRASSSSTRRPAASTPRANTSSTAPWTV